MRTDTFLQVAASGLLPWLADVTLQSTAVLGLAWSWILLRRGMSAARRHAILGWSLASIPLLMVLSAVIPAGHWPIPGRGALVESPLPGTSSPQGTFGKTLDLRASSETGTRQSVFHSMEGEISGAGAPQARAGYGAPVKSLEGGFISNWRNWSRCLPWIWFLGIVTGLIGFLFSAVQLAQWRRQSPEEGDSRVLAVFDKLLSQKGPARRKVVLRRSTRTAMPMTWGWRRPTIVLPNEAVQWPENRLLLVLGHELAHIRRGDNVSAPMASLAALLLWFHPMVWLTLRQMGRCRESACDDEVLQSAGQNPGDYAQELLQAISGLSQAVRGAFWAPALALAMAIRDRRELKLRLRAILEPEQDRQPCTLGLQRVLALGLAVALPLLSGLSACRRPSDTPTAAAAVGNLEAPQVFFLTNQQWLSLTAGMNAGTYTGILLGGAASAGDVKKEAKSDPKADDLHKAALYIRSYLMEQGVQFRQSGDGEGLKLRDGRTLLAWMDDKNQAKLTAVLASMSEERLIQITGRLLTAPVSPDSIERMGVSPIKDAKGIIHSAMSREQGEALLQRLMAVPGCHVIVTPTLTMVSGQRAITENVREFRYPTEFNPPQISSQGGVTADGSYPVTPTTPTAFEMRPVGVRIEFNPFLQADGRISLTLAPEVTSFEGFINYGTPIMGKGKGENGRMEEVILTPNKIIQPVFVSVKFVTEAKLADGDWLLLGGAGMPAGVTTTVNLPEMVNKEDLDPTKLPSMLEPASTLYFLLQVRLVGRAEN